MVKIFFVPCCPNSSTKTPPKVFLSVPKGKIRKKWITAARPKNLVVCSHCKKNFTEWYNKWSLWGYNISNVTLSKLIFYCSVEGRFWKLHEIQIGSFYKLTVKGRSSTSIFRLPKRSETRFYCYIYTLLSYTAWWRHS